MPKEQKHMTSEAEGGGENNDMSSHSGPLRLFSPLNTPHPTSDAPGVPLPYVLTENISQTTSEIS